MDLLSAPAWKWQVAQEVTPSLPTCISQKRVFPNLIASALFFTNSPRLSGSGTDTLLSETGGDPVTCADTLFPAITATIIITAIAIVLENLVPSWLSLPKLSLHHWQFIFIIKDLSKIRPLEVSRK